MKSLLPTITSLAPIHHLYDVFIIDLWGVMHDGISAYSGALDALKQLKESGKKVIFLSNAPRREHAARTQLETRGIPNDLGVYDGLYTSGEDCHRALCEGTYSRFGQTFFHLGPDKDKSIFEDIPLTAVTDLKDASMIVNTGVHEWDNTVEDYGDLLAEGVARGLPMICANPDKIVVLGEKMVVCAGALAASYEAQGGTVFYHGKPYPAIYQNLCACYGIDPLTQKIVVIGDSLETDIQGGASQQWDTMLILQGIYRDVFSQFQGDAQATVSALSAQHKGLPPTYAAPLFSWL